MDREKMRRLRHKKMVNGKRKRVGILEYILLKHAGKKDGRRGLPRKTEEGSWRSPFMDREKNGYAEFCAHTWGSLQIENEERFAELEKEMDTVRKKEEILEEAVSTLESANKIEFEAGKGAVPRKNGEENLTEAQVLSRRKTEAARRLAPLRSRVTSLENELKEEEDKLFKLYTSITEDENTTRMICYRLKEHLLMRMDVYWESALLFHHEGDDMPVLPEQEFSNEAEDKYMQQHRELMERVRQMHGIFLADYGKEAE